MVLHVVRLALLRHHLLVEAARLELGEDRLVADAHDVCQHVEPATMRHADHRVTGALLACHAQDHLEHRDHRVEPFDAEPLLPQVGLVQESLESLNGGQPLEEGAALIGAQGLTVLSRLDHAT